jgi:hypothetical protein
MRASSSLRSCLSLGLVAAIKRSASSKKASLFVFLGFESSLDQLLQYLIGASTFAFRKDLDLAIDLGPQRDATTHKLFYVLAVAIYFILHQDAPLRTMILLHPSVACASHEYATAAGKRKKLRAVRR